MTDTPRSTPAFGKAGPGPSDNWAGQANKIDPADRFAGLSLKQINLLLLRTPVRIVNGVGVSTQPEVYSALRRAAFAALARESRQPTTPQTSLT